MNTKKTILITGGAGFIGSNFVRYLFDKYRDYRLCVLDALTYAGSLENIPDEVKNSNRFEFHYGDVLNSHLVQYLVSQSDVVVHFAAETHVARSIFDDSKFFLTDVIGTQNIASAVVKFRDRIERFIHISSSEVYGTATVVPMDEKHPFEPTTPYAAAKAGADRLVYSYYVCYDIPSIILRPFNNYGPYQHLEKVIPRFITRAMIGEPLKIHGDGRARRDWIFVDDTCRAIDAAIHVPIETLMGQVVNVARGEDFSIYDVAKMICKAFGLSESNLQFTNERPGQVQRHIADTKKAKELLGWEAKMRFRDGLIKTIEWYKANGDWWKKKELMKEVVITKRDGTQELY